MKTEKEQARQKINRAGRKAWQTLEQLRALDPELHHMAVVMTCIDKGITLEDWDRTMNALRDGLVPPLP